MRVGHLHVVSQQAVGHDRGDVFQCGGRRQLPLRRELLLRVADARAGTLLDALDVVTQVTQALAVLEMLAAVMAFLADEAANLPLEHRVVDAVAEVAHRIDEEAFAVGKQHRHGIEQVGLEGVAAVPVARQRVGQIEVHVSGANLQSFRCGAGHEGSIALFDWRPL